MPEPTGVDLTKETIIESARRVISHEADALVSLSESLDESFGKVINVLLECKGRVIVSGVGKSGLIGRKICATFLSTGTPAVFLHPTEGVHGDLGAVNSQDIVLLLSNSGESDEILSLIPALKSIGARIVGITGKPESSLGKCSDIVLKCRVKCEADPHNLVPSASTSAQLALGDALALVLMEQRGMNPDDMARRHPAGVIGRRLLLKVADLMHSEGENPMVGVGDTFREALFELTAKRLGAVSVIDDKGGLEGIITDGDLKRLLESAEKEKWSIDYLMETGVREIMISNPKRVSEVTLAIDALKYMEKHQISQIPVVDEGDKVVGMLRLLDLVKAGL